MRNDGIGRNVAGVAVVTGVMGLLLAAAPALARPVTPGATPGPVPAVTARVEVGAALPAGETPAPDVQTLVDEALKRSPSLSSLQARLAAARIRVSPAGALPDPVIEVMYQHVGVPYDPMRPMSMGRFEVSQPIFYPGKRRARREAASAEAEVRLAEIGRMRRALATEVRKAYARIL